MDSPIKFSVIVPVYKAEKYIAECIESVQRQSCQNFELILVDDGSPDKSGDICRQYAAADARLKVFHKENGGQISARVYGIEKACGDYCFFLDSDDFIAPDSLETLSGYIALHGADCLIFGINWLKPGGTVQVKCRDEYCGRLISDKAELMNIVINDSSYNSVCRKCVRRSCLELGDLSHWHRFRRGEDLLQSLKMIENCSSFLFVPELLYYYRVNDLSVTHTLNFDGYKADFGVDEYALEMLGRLGVFSDADYDRMRNFSLDRLCIELKRISRFCSDKAEMCSAFDSIRATGYYKDFLSPGYKKAPALPGVVELRGIRRIFNRLLTALLSEGSYGPMIFINRKIYR